MTIKSEVWRVKNFSPIIMTKEHGHGSAFGSFKIAVGSGNKVKDGDENSSGM